MATDQVEKRLTWLDEQRRRDAEALGRVHDQLAGLQETLSQQSRQLKEMSSELTRLGALSTRINQFDETLTKQRQDFSRQLEEANERRAEREREIEELRKTELEEIKKAIDALEVEIGRFDPLDTAIEARREEDIRLTRELDALEKRLEDLTSNTEDRSRAIVSLEESRKQDNRRITDLQSEASDLRGRTDAVRGAVDAIEDRIRRIDTRVSEVASGESERREAQATWTERQTLKLAEFERSWKEWQERFEAFEQKAADLDERKLAYEETYREMKSLRDELKGVVERLDRRINEISEMQRLAEDRLKQEWTSYQADAQKQWNTFKLTHDEEWREHKRLHEKLSLELQTLDENSVEALERVAEVREVSSQRILDLLAVVREWAAEVEARAGER